MSTTHNLDIVELNRGEVIEDSDASSAALILGKLGCHDLVRGFSTCRKLDAGVMEADMEAPPESPCPTTFPMLLLPLELRLLIYEPLIAIGDLSILRANKQVHAETASVTKKNAILRMTLVYLIWNSGPALVDALPSIQQVESPLDMGNGYRPYHYFDRYIDFIELLGGIDVARNRCTIILYLDRPDCVPPQVYFTRLALWQYISDLSGFETVHIETSRDSSESDESLIDQAWLPKELISYPREMYLEDSKELCAVLEKELGPAAVNASHEGFCLKFNPRRFKAKTSSETVGGI